MERRVLETADCRLAYVDFGGEGPVVLLLHGMFGRATTWRATARWLTPHFRVIGLDQRGHGWSDKPDHAYTRNHYVTDLERFMDALGLGPAIIIGHSMGALNAWVLAARRPDLVRALVLEDMTAATKDPGNGAWAKAWLDQWPVPFPTMADVRAYFGRIRPGMADYFMEVMVEAPDGYRPLFEAEHMVQTAAGFAGQDYWAELEQVRCPALVVKGSESDYRREDLQEMARRLPNGRYAEIEGAHHTVAFDQPERWRAVVEPFLLALR